MVATTSSASGQSSALFVHQIYLEVGLGTYADHAFYQKNVHKIKDIHARSHRLWLDEDIAALWDKYAEFQPLLLSFPLKFHKIDFSKLLVLYDQPENSTYEVGGVSLPCIVRCVLVGVW